MIAGCLKTILLLLIEPAPYAPDIQASVSMQFLAVEPN